MLVRVHANGVCGTDASEFTGARMYPLHERHALTGHRGPLIPGHEFAGASPRSATASKDLPKATRSSPARRLVAASARNCRAGRTSICALYATVGPAPRRRPGRVRAASPRHIVFRTEPFGLATTLRC